MKVVWRGGGPWRLQECCACRVGRLHLTGYPDTTLYDRDYYETSYLPRQDSLERYFMQQLQEIERSLEPGPLLDVGCGIGLFVRAALGRGWDAWGIDPSPAACDLARVRCGDDRIVEGDLDTVGFADRRFRVVTFWDVLAHIPEAPRTLRIAADLLEDDGRIVIKTPHRPASMIGAVRIIGAARKSFGDHLLHLPRQLWHFTPDSLRALLGRTGLELIDWSASSEVEQEAGSGGWGPKRLLRTGAGEAVKRAQRFPSFLALARKKPGSVPS